MESLNQAQNGGTDRVFLLPMAVGEGSPVHPAYPSGHAINLGAYITVLKVRRTDDRTFHHYWLVLPSGSSATVPKAHMLDDLQRVQTSASASVCPCVEFDTAVNTRKRFNDAPRK